MQHLLFLSACLFGETVFHEEHKNPLSVQSSINTQQPLWTGNASSLWRVMISTAEEFISLCVFFSHAHTFVVVYLCQVEQYLCLPISWMLALMCSSYCGRCASSALLWPIRRRQGFLQGLAPVALGRNVQFPYRKPCCCLELRNARNVHNWPPFFFQASSFMLLVSLWGLFSQWEVVLFLYCIQHRHTPT